MAQRECAHLRSGPERKRRVRFGVGVVCVIQTLPLWLSVFLTSPSFPFYLNSHSPTLFHFYSPHTHALTLITLSPWRCTPSLPSHTCCASLSHSLPSTTLISSSTSSLSAANLSVELANWERSPRRHRFLVQPSKLFSISTAQPTIVSMLRLLPRLLIPNRRSAFAFL